MNKQDKEVFLKKNITMYAKKIRDIQSNQIDPFIKLIEEELRQLYPVLIDKEDGIENWAYDIINSSSNSEVIETLDRIEQILDKEYKEKWTCCICGENTFNVDCEYLDGVDHLSCLSLEELKTLKTKNKNDSLTNIKNELESLKNYTKQLNELESLKNYTKQLEEQIQKLEGYYNEPTN